MGKGAGRRRAARANIVPARPIRRQMKEKTVMGKGTRVVGRTNFGFFGLTGLGE